MNNYKQTIVLEKTKASFIKLLSQNTKYYPIMFGKNTLLPHIGTENISPNALFTFIMKVHLPHELSKPPLPWRLSWEKFINHCPKQPERCSPFLNNFCTGVVLGDIECQDVPSSPKLPVSILDQLPCRLVEPRLRVNSSTVSYFKS